MGKWIEVADDTEEAAIIRWTLAAELHFRATP
jgi:hypothetical protein